MNITTNLSCPATPALRASLPAFDEAMVAYETANATFLAGCALGSEATDDETSRLGHLRVIAFESALSAPAENYSAFARKVRLVAEEMIEFEADEAFGAVHLLKDIARLAAPKHRSDWDVALAAFKEADAADQTDPEGEHEELEDAMLVAREKLVLTPAPDNVALAYKIAVVNRFDMFGDGFMNGAPTRSIMADAKRLAGVA